MEYHGGVDAKGREEAVQRFEGTPAQPHDPACRFIVSNPQVGGYGNTWLRGTTVIYYSNDYNLESREQSEDRAHRIGQSGAIHGDETEPSVLYIDLRAKGTVDEKIIKVLRAKKKLTDEVVASNWQWLMGSSVA